MKYTKLGVGIALIILAIIILIQAIFYTPNVTTSMHILTMIAGIIIAALYLASGIVYVCTFRSDGLGGDIACLSMLVVSWVLGMATIKVDLSLQLWAWLALIVGGGFFAWQIVENRD